MREFSGFEKEVIRYITTKPCVKAPYAATYIMELFFSETIKIETINSEIRIQVAVLSGSNKYDPNFYRELLEFIYLFDYLHKNQLIFYMEEAHGHTIEYRNINNRKIVFAEITTDKGTLDLLKTLLKSLVFAAQPLICLSENKFKTDEQIRFEEQLRVSKRQTNIGCVATGISFIGLLAAISIPFWTSTKIDEDSTKEIEKIIRENKITIPQTINTNITNDTLKVNVINSPSTKTNHDQPK